MEQLINDIRQCRICVDKPLGSPLPHEPRPVFQVSKQARLCLCGQAPGTRVHASGKPFTDPSGDRLREWLGIGTDVFYDAQRVAIIPMGFCFPGLNDKGGDLPPRRECAAAWREKLFLEFPQFELVVLIGQYAQQWHLGRRCGKTLTDTVSSWQTILNEQEQPRYFPVPHPSWRNNRWLKNNPWFEADALPVLRRYVKDIVSISQT